MTTIVGPAVFATGILQHAGSKLCRHVKTRDVRIIAPALSHAFTDLTRVFFCFGYGDRNMQEWSKLSRFAMTRYILKSLDHPNAAFCASSREDSSDRDCVYYFFIS